MADGVRRMDHQEATPRCDRTITTQGSDDTHQTNMEVGQSHEDSLQGPADEGHVYGSLHSAGNHNDGAQHFNNGTTMQNTLTVGAGPHNEAVRSLHSDDQFHPKHHSDDQLYPTQSMEEADEMPNNVVVPLVQKAPTQRQMMHPEMTIHSIRLICATNSLPTGNHAGGAHPAQGTSSVKPNSLPILGDSNRRVVTLPRRLIHRLDRPLPHFDILNRETFHGIAPMNSLQPSSAEFDNDDSPPCSVPQEFGTGTERKIAKTAANLERQQYTGTIFATGRASRMLPSGNNTDPQMEELGAVGGCDSSLYLEMDSLDHMDAISRAPPMLPIENYTDPQMEERRVVARGRIDRSLNLERQGVMVTTSQAPHMLPSRGELAQVVDQHQPEQYQIVLQVDQLVQENVDLRMQLDTARQMEEEALQREQEAKQREEEAKQREEEAKQREEEALQREEEMRRELQELRLLARAARK